MVPEPILRQFRIYQALSRARRLNYRDKVLLVAAIGILLPALLLYGAFNLAGSVPGPVLAVPVLLALASAATALVVLHHLLYPIIAMAQALRVYRVWRTVPKLPSGFSDEVGTLMADGMMSLAELEVLRDELAAVDRVTGLPNRAALLREVAARLTTGGELVVCAIRLNGYYRFAEEHGQTAGDNLVQGFAAAAQRIAGGRAYIARIEPGLFAAAYAASGTHREMAEKLGKALDQIAGESGIGPMPAYAPTEPYLSAGLTFAPEDSSVPADLLDHAIVALEPRFVDDRAQVRFYSHAVRENVVRHERMGEELQRAIEKLEFHLHYQPVIDFRLGRVVGAEALLRWQHPERGLLYPGNFLPMAMASGFIGPLGHHVLDMATDQLAAWAAAGRDDLRIAINISAQQFRDRDLLKVIRTAIESKNIGAGRLELELTGTAAMEDRDRAREILGLLREAGVAITMDDFGMGSTSMFGLVELPFDRMKICHQFVSGLGSNRKARAICSALIALSGGLKAEIVAEGVEAADEAVLLREMGARYFQGYFFAKPMPAEKFFALANDLRFATKVMATFDDDRQPPEHALAG